MMRLLKYELKRLILNKISLGFLVIVGLFAWQTLTGNIIRGTGYTAPFSSWSYGHYLASVMPLLSVTPLFSCHSCIRKAEKGWRPSAEQGGH